LGTWFLPGMPANSVALLGSLCLGFQNTFIYIAPANNARGRAPTLVGRTKKKKTVPHARTRHSRSSGCIAWMPPASSKTHSAPVGVFKTTRHSLASTYRLLHTASISMRVAFALFTFLPYHRTVAWVHATPATHLRLRLSRFAHLGQRTSHLSWLRARWDCGASRGVYSSVPFRSDERTRSPATSHVSLALSFSVSTRQQAVFRNRRAGTVARGRGLDAMTRC